MVVLYFLIELSHMNFSSLVLRCCCKIYAQGQKSESRHAISTLLVRVIRSCHDDQSPPNPKP